MYPRRFTLVFLLSVALFLCALLLVAVHPRAFAQEQSNLRINEFMADNDSIVVDPDEPADANPYEDWFEIYNAGATAVNLQELYLTDDLTNLTKFQITQAITISARGFLILWADEDLEQGPSHVGFKLSKDGGDLALVASDGTTIIDSYTYGPQTSDISEGRTFDGAGPWIAYQEATPGRSNLLMPPVISSVTHTPTLPISGEQIEISAVVTDSNAVRSVTLYYTTDGATFRSRAMGDIGDNQYQAALRLQAEGSSIHAAAQTHLVSYYVEARDADDQTSRSPRNAPQDVYKFLLDYTPPMLYLNEVMADNVDVLEDPQQPGAFPDWFELYNPTTQTIELQGLALTDNIDDPMRAPITQALTISPGGYLLFYADDDPEKGPTHLSFRLNAGGESVYLMGPEGAYVIDSITFGGLSANQAYGRFPDGTGEAGIPLCPSPGATNIVCNQFVFLPSVAGQAINRGSQ